MKDKTPAVNNNPPIFYIFIFVTLLVLAVGQLFYKPFGKTSARAPQKIARKTSPNPQAVSQEKYSSDTQETETTTGIKLETPSPQPYTLILSGEITKNQEGFEVIVDPLFTFPTMGASNSPDLKENSFYSITLIQDDAPIYTIPIEPKSCVDLAEDNTCLKFDHTEGTFSAAITDLDNLPEKLVVNYQDQEIYSSESSFEMPIVEITKEDYVDGRIIIEWTNNSNVDLVYMAIVSNDDFETGTPLVSQHTNRDGSDIFTDGGFHFSYKSFIKGPVKVRLLASDGIGTLMYESGSFGTTE